MTSLFIFVYNLFLFTPLLRIAAILKGLNPKLKEGFKLRQTRPWRKNPWPESHTVLWFHCASGEFEYAKPVITKFKDRHPEFKIVVTYFSPSVRRSVEAFSAVDLALPAPWDDQRSVGEFLDAFHPRCLLIARTDLWPQMLSECRKRKIPSLLFSATLTKRSRRLRGLNSWFAGWITGLITTIHCVDPEDAELFHELVPKGDIHVHGDTRFDQVVARLQHPKPLHPIAFRSRVFVAGSTWPGDEVVLLEAVVPFLQQGQMQLVLVPHEPIPTHLTDIEKRLAEFKLDCRLYSQTPAESYVMNEPVLIVDQVGILSELYQWGEVAFVGGSFGQGVHSVMEPLAAGCPTFVGPQHLNNREALRFQKSKYVYNGRTPVIAIRSALELREHLQTHLRLDPQTITAEKSRIRSQIEDCMGASESTVNWIMTHLGTTASPHPLTTSKWQGVKSDHTSEDFT